MQYDIHNSIKIPIEMLAIGMFVTAIERTKRVNLTNAGRVSNDHSIAQLVTNGVTFVWVDVALSAEGSVSGEIDAFLRQNETSNETSSEGDVSITASEALAKSKKQSRFAQHKRASKIIREAKGLAQKLINQTFEGKTIDVVNIDQWADDLIELVAINSDALQCISALRNKDKYLLEHSVNVAFLLVNFGKYLQLPQDTLKQLAIGGIIHDIGKIKVDDKVLLKPSRLTPEEFDQIKLHQVYAKQMITNVRGLSHVARDVCLMHHEKLDGKGYPLGLKGEQIPLHGRMTSIVDIYDALTSDRCYKKGMSSAEAFKILLGLAPHHLDQTLVYKFINCIGVYPVGAIVELSDGRVGIVWSSNQLKPLKPEVKCFYSRKYKRYLDVTYVDLKHTSVNIERAIAPYNLEINATPFFDLK
ncbi:HD-GYP domain-containing protein [Vibrio renipiscarius]|uniref:HD-GYP domain-containing protein n=1 Tax=Vibrio renipiscarius TaxID=1461322 RepID=UPI00355222F2